MSIQLIHIETYGLEPSLPKKGSKRKEAKRSLRAVIEEAERVPSECMHVTSPQDPTILYGEPPMVVLEEIERLAAKVKEDARRARKQPKKGKRKPTLRKDAQLAICGIASFPHSSSSVVGNKPLLSELLLWQEDTVGFLKSEWGMGLKSVVIHLDEDHPNIHFIIHSDIAAGEFTLDDRHPGWRAAYAACPKINRGPGSRKARDRAYKIGMTEFQDRFYSIVSIKHGHTRLGPRRRRLSREQWRAEKIQGQALKLALDEAHKVRTALAREENAARQDVVELKENARRDIEIELDKIRTLVSHLGKWVLWFEKHARLVPHGLKSALQYAGQLIGPPLK